MQRRLFIKATGGLLLGSAMSPMARAQVLAMPGDSCRPTVRLTAGPYYTLDSLNRADIREDRPGVPLTLSFTVVDDFWCTPVQGAIVDVWHADAGGIYSGVVNSLFDNNTLQPSGTLVDTRDRPTFLRGHQVADAAGRVTFNTVFPGWYSGRLAHIHVRALFPGAADWSAFVTQLFLPPAIEREVWSTDPYRARGGSPMSLERDLVLRGDADALDRLTIPMERTANGVRGEMVLAI